MKNPINGHDPPDPFSRTSYIHNWIWATGGVGNTYLSSFLGASSTSTGVVGGAAPLVTLSLPSPPKKVDRASK